MEYKLCIKCKLLKPTIEFYKKKSTKDKLSCYCKECGKKDTKEYNNKNRERVKIRNREYYKNHSEKIKQKEKERRSTIEYKNYYKEYSKKYLLETNHKIAHSIRVRTRQVLKTHKVKDSLINMLGCSINSFRVYIESKFKVGMNWNNYGVHGWHIDHIIPCYNFNLENPEEQKKCFIYTNLQPMWAKDNLSKNKYLK